MTLICGVFSLSADIAQAADSDGPQKKNYVGATATFLNGVTLYGINSKIGVVDNVSLRPFIEFGSVSANNSSASIIYYGSSVTYDLNINNSAVAYGGVGIAGISAFNNQDSASANGSYAEIGVDYNPTNNFVINANYKIGGSGFLSVGAGYRF
jgi:opacity protein-like surface antigen